MIRYITVLLSLLFSLSSYSQLYRYPLTIPPALSGGFGELRNNHFHSGTDFKTQQAVNKPVLAIEDGYVSRISVSPGGYGLALYLDHPSTGHTSVYGHLNSFSKEIADYVKEKQYELESFSVNLYPEADALPVKRGQQIALSGNTGSSGGPHLHFEIRNLKTEEPLDALEFIPAIQDTQKPEIRGIAFYTVRGKGVLNGSENPIRLNISKDGNGDPLGLGRTINAWGRIGVGVKAYDRMNGQNNIYGVKYIRLFVDDKKIFSSNINRFSFSDTRMLNSFIDFEDWRKRRSFFMKSFVEPGNSLPFYETVNNGFIDINEEREYNLRYELEDHYGNALNYQFKINGKPQPIQKPALCKNWMAWNMNNSHIEMGFTINIPTGNLYTDFCFKYDKQKNVNYYSDIHKLHDNPVPLHNRAEIWIKLDNDTLSNRNNYGVVRINDNGSDSWIGGKYNRGGISTTIRELGDSYAISADTQPPTITPVSPENWASQRRIRIRLTDNKSGVASFRGEINGKFVLFTHDSKSSVYTYNFDDTRLPKGEKLTLIFTAVDGAGNKSEYKKEL
ncbi:MAG: M23 family metallopeptidase [Fermentimonas sp.]|nr:M23 family metallopeptidase [Fermentimonas sp.]